MSDSRNNIKVVARFRPLNSIEKRENSEVVVSFDDNAKTVMLRGEGRDVALAGSEKDGFTFDRVFGMETMQEHIYSYGIQETVQDVMKGYNGTVFSYGQTGSGKTYTMMGSDIDDPLQKGITPRITEQIFEEIARSPPALEFLVKVSYMEIYMERIRDLLAPQNDNLQVHEEKNRGVYVKGLVQFNVSDAAEVYQIMRQGQGARVTSSTNMNAESSRSHSIFVITISQRNMDTGEAKNGYLYLVDLAGSEKIGKTGATGQTLEEAKKINKSLSALGIVINALTDGKSQHVPYRDSKLTRILQESLGGNARTTLIINCSPASYNEAETLSTLRFGMRAKSIKNQARVNKELSPAELRHELKKTKEYVARLEAELAHWRSGQPVDQTQWASTASGSGPSALPSKVSVPNSGTTSRSATPSNPLVDGLRDLPTSRPMTPGPAMDKDEREDFLRRENEFNDQLAEKESVLVNLEKTLRDLREEVALYKQRGDSFSTELKASSAELNDLRLNKERLEYDNKEAGIQIDTLQEQISEHERELDELRRQVEQLRTHAKDAVAEEKERRKAEKMAAMMAKFDAEGTLSEKEEGIRLMLAKLDAVDNEDPSTALSQEDVALLHRQLSEGQALLRDSHDRLRQAQEDAGMFKRRREEVEQRLGALETEYEELLERTIREEEASNVDIAESMADLKAKLEAQYAAKRDVQLGEISDLRQQLETRAQQNRDQATTIDSLKGVNEELKRAFAVSSAGIEGSRNLQESAKDLERTRKAIALQLSDFEGSKRSLMRDLQNRCEKVVVELEIQLDDLREHYNTVIKAANSKTQQKKMAFLERNLDQLGLVQKQLVDQNTAMKKEASIAERKLLARNERILNLEQLLQDADRRLVQQNAKFESQLIAMKERIEAAKAQKVAHPSFAAGRIAKPIRGGGGSPAGALAATVQSSSSASYAGVPGSPLSRVQGEDGTGSVGPGASASQKRASWFFSNNR